MTNLLILAIKRVWPFQIGIPVFNDIAEARLIRT